ncbi:MAG: tRNA (N(6)-L-threonylcarbamoyladenosine(37)-C(2))-methylthiotransferase MtaB [Proteobacteria bacterium]|nr:tRNA (N(6)-L-threonylcarbamoyladenosine(37)-C(2))-methylthiotransferase MtaB [Pseudomonadota bacterium]NIS71386.1 tRNA (N(6)-L-threonylcarbamoyladenosine(37)-C(2))-methylthiotransferase MtaB [Pseudomonadota bacterium]
MNGRRVAITTLGCKANQFDSEVMREELTRLGFDEVPFDEKADVYIINTCTVTGKSDYQSRQLIRRAHRLNPNAVIIATGCYAEVFPQEVSELDGVSGVLGNQAKREVGPFVSSLMMHRKPLVRVTPVVNGPLEESDIEGFSRHCRAFLKIQDGCDGACSYCIVPRARGRSRSLPPEKAMEALSRLKAGGYDEIVLTGIHLGGYGLDLTPSTSLARFVQLLESAPDIPPRIRLSSLEPTDLTEELLEAVERSKVICPHLHIPLQSGDNEILVRMNRGYKRDRFQALIFDIAERIPHICIGLDVMGGFPGEGENQFRNTVELIEELPVAYLHVFRFSPRRGTAAFDLPQKVKSDEIRRRCAILRELGQKKRETFYGRFLHQRLGVLEEKTTVDEAGWRRGISRNYIPVWVEPKETPSDHEIDVEITEVRGQKVWGRRV